jgi:hypothetical protein
VITVSGWSTNPFRLRHGATSGTEMMLGILDAAKDFPAEPGTLLQACQNRCRT